MPSYRRVPVGADVENAVTVGIERTPEKALRAAVWWPSHGDVDADEAEYGDVGEALRAASAAKDLHGFAEVVVTLQSDDLWNEQSGTLHHEREPIGRINETALSNDEAYELAAGIEENRDA